LTVCEICGGAQQASAGAAVYCGAAVEDGLAFGRNGEKGRRHGGGEQATADGFHEHTTPRT
jgi:hypothetical protein